MRYIILTILAYLCTLAIIVVGAAAMVFYVQPYNTIERPITWLSFGVAYIFLLRPLIKYWFNKLKPKKK